MIAAIEPTWYLVLASLVFAIGAEAPGDSNIRELARNLFSDHVFAFEFTSVLLIVAVAGTVLLTRKEKRREGDS